MTPNVCHRRGRTTTGSRRSSSTRRVRVPGRHSLRWAAPRPRGEATARRPVSPEEEEAPWVHLHHPARGMARQGESAVRARQGGCIENKSSNAGRSTAYIEGGCSYPCRRAWLGSWWSSPSVRPRLCCGFSSIQRSSRCSRPCCEGTGKGAPAPKAPAGGAAVKVVVRVRPLSAAEVARGESNTLEVVRPDPRGEVCRGVPCWDLARAAKMRRSLGVPVIARPVIGCR